MRPTPTACMRASCPGRGMTRRLNAWYSQPGGSVKRRLSATCRHRLDSPNLSHEIAARPVTPLPLSSDPSLLDGPPWVLVDEFLGSCATPVWRVSPRTGTAVESCAESCTARRHVRLLQSRSDTARSSEAVARPLAKLSTRGRARSRQNSSSSTPAAAVKEARIR